MLQYKHCRGHIRSKNGCTSNEFSRMMHANFCGVHWCQVVMGRYRRLYKLNWPSIVSWLDPSVTEAMTHNASNKETGWTLQWQRQWCLLLWTKKQDGPFSDRSNDAYCFEQRDPSVTEAMMPNAFHKETLQWQKQWCLTLWTKTDWTLNRSNDDVRSFIC